MPREGARFSGLIMASAMAHLGLICMTQWAEPAAPVSHTPAPRPIIQAQLVYEPKKSPQPLPDQELSKVTPNPQPQDNKELTAPPEADAIIEESVTRSASLDQLSEATQQQIRELLRMNTAKPKPQKNGGSRYIPANLSTANLPEYLQNKSFPEEDLLGSETGWGKSNYAKGSPIAEEITMSNGDRLVRMKSGACVLVQDQQQLDSELSGKMWLHYGGCKKKESLAWLEFQRRMAQYGKEKR